MVLRNFILEFCFKLQADALLHECVSVGKEMAVFLFNLPVKCLRRLKNKPAVMRGSEFEVNSN